MMTERINPLLTIDINDDGDVFSHNGRGQRDHHGKIPIRRVEQIRAMRDDLLIERAVVREEFRDAAISARSTPSRWLGVVLTGSVLVLALVASIVLFDPTAGLVQIDPDNLCVTARC